MDRHRGGDRESSGGVGGRYPRMQSRWSSGSPNSGPHHRYPNHSRGGGGRGDGFSSGGGGRHHPYRNPNDYPSPHGGGGDVGSPGFRSGAAGGDGFGNQMPIGGGGLRRGGGFFQGGSPPDFKEGSNFAKLFVGSVPRTATEEEIRPLFDQHGEVIEVALIKDKRTGQQQGCCFIKYATSEEADRAIRGLHNQVTLPGGTGPIQVRYADGERERLGAVEHKLFVGALNRQATEKEIEEIFAPYGRVEDVYIMRDELKQSRGCGFVKFSTREMAVSAMNALSGTYVMRGCEQPLIVRFADPKRPRPGEPRGGPAFGGPGFGHRSQQPFGNRPPNFGEPMGGRVQPNAWHPESPQPMGTSSQATNDGFSHNLAGGAGVMTSSTAPLDNLGFPGGPLNGSLTANAVKPSAQQGFPPSMSQVQPVGQQVSPAQNILTSSQHLLPSTQLQQNQQALGPQPQTLQPIMQQLGQHQVPHSFGSSSSHVSQSRQLIGHGGQLSSPPPLMQQNVPAGALQTPLGLQQQGIPGSANLPTTNTSQVLQQPNPQLPAQLSQALLQQQAQSLQSSFQSSQQAISQLQQQLQLMQQSNLNQQQNSQPVQQPQWTGVASLSGSSTPSSTPAAVMPTTVSATPSLPAPSIQPAVPLACNWTEHTSPQGFKYYYNSVTKESKWEKPEELTMFEQQQQQQKLLLLQQQQQKLAIQQLQLSSQSQVQTHNQTSQQLPHMQQTPQPLQMNQQAQIQHLQPSLAYQSSAVGHQNIQGYQASQEWTWKNRPSGS